MREKHENDELDCKSCGACCVTHDVEMYVPVTALDRRRLPTKYKNKLETLQYEEGETGEPYAFGLKSFGDRKGCIALKGRLGKDISCDVYSVRPDFCRTFERGSDECLERRAAAFIIIPTIVVD